MSTNSVERFCSRTGSDEELARLCLSASNGDLDDAVSLFHSANNPEELRQMLSPNPAPPEERRPEGGGIFSAISNILTSPFRLAWNYRSWGDANEELIASDFVRAFEQKYGEQRPQFQESGLKDAVESAEQQSKFLFAYVHSPEHQDTDDFCRCVLASSEVVTFLNQNFVCWGGNVQRKSAFRLANDVGATAFPFICLLGMIGSQVTSVASIHGMISAADLMNVLRQSLEQEASAFNAQRAERRRHEADRQLRADQDLEYQQALEADRERDRKKREEAEARAALEEQQRQIAEQARLAKEAEEQQKQRRDQNIERRRIQKKSALQPEPVQTNAIITIRVRLPDGSTHTRRFLETDKVQLVYDFVDGLDGLQSWDYTLASSYPKTDFVQETRDKSLSQMGVEHSATLLVQSHDD